MFQTALICFQLNCSQKGYWSRSNSSTPSPSTSVISQLTTNTYFSPSFHCCITIRIFWRISHGTLIPLLRRGLIEKWRRSNHTHTHTRTLFSLLKLHLRLVSTQGASSSAEPSSARDIAPFTVYFTASTSTTAAAAIIFEPSFHVLPCLYYYNVSMYLSLYPSLSPSSPLK